MNNETMNNETTINGVIILAAMAGGGALHTILAALGAKARARQWFGLRLADGLYRLLYNVVAAFTFLPVIALVTLLPDVLLYRLPTWALAVTIPVQALSALGMVWSLWRLDLPRFVGVRQMLRWMQGAPDPRDPPKLVTNGIHGWVRHPLYFFSLALLWLTPIMTVNVLALDVGITLYFWIGSVFEERKLAAEFGEAYREHQRRVPRLFPIKIIRR